MQPLQYPESQGVQLEAIPHLLGPEQIQEGVFSKVHGPGPGGEIEHEEILVLPVCPALDRDPTGRL